MSKIKFFLATKGFILGIIFAGVLAFGIYSALAAWVGPPGSPPTCPATTPGCNVPINISTTAQNKAGNLTIGGKDICLKNADGTSTCPSSTSMAPVGGKYPSGYVYAYPCGSFEGINGRANFGGGPTGSRYGTTACNSGWRYLIWSWPMSEINFKGSGLCIAQCE